MTVPRQPHGCALRAEPAGDPQGALRPVNGWEPLGPAGRRVLRLHRCEQGLCPAFSLIPGADLWAGVDFWLGF